jgi:hypothetical protein
MTRHATATPAQRRQADRDGMIVVQYLDDEAIAVVAPHEGDYPPRPLRVLYRPPVDEVDGS